MSQTKASRKDPRIESFLKALHSSVFENFSAQARGIVVAISKDAITVKDGKNKAKFLMNRESAPTIIKIKVTEKGKQAKEIPLSEVRKGKRVTVNTELLPSGDWKAFGVAVREEVKSSE
ncbi:MAG: hypothetical protein WC519_00400 [Parcubacteria group bacterium]